MNKLTHLYRSILIIFICLGATNLKAQFTERIGSGRPGNANGAFSVGEGVYQIQAGYNDYRGDFNSINRNSSSADAIIRIGIKEDFELRLSSGFIFQEDLDFDQQPDEIYQSEVSGVNLGVRQTLFMQNGILPATAIQFTTNFGDSGTYSTPEPDATFRLNFSNRIGEKLNLNWNFSSRWSSQQSGLTGFYIFSFGYPLTDQLAVTAEAFGNFNKFRLLDESVFAGVGFAYFVNDDLQFDVYGSYGNVEFSGDGRIREEMNLTVGISYRIVKRKD